MPAFSGIAWPGQRSNPGARVGVAQRGEQERAGTPVDSLARRQRRRRAGRAEPGSDRFTERSGRLPRSSSGGGAGGDKICPNRTRETATCWHEKVTCGIIVTRTWPRRIGGAYQKELAGRRVDAGIIGTVGRIELVFSGQTGPRGSSSSYKQLNRSAHIVFLFRRGGGRGRARPNSVCEPRQQTELRGPFIKQAWRCMGLHIDKKSVENGGNLQRFLYFYIF